MPLLEFLHVLDRLSIHGAQFVLESSVKDELSEDSPYHNANKISSIRNFFKKNGLIFIRGSPFEMAITYLGLDALSNETFKQWLQSNKDYRLVIPPLSLFLMERQNSQNLDFLFRNSTGFDIWATTGQNFIGYLETIFSGQNKLAAYASQKIRILVFDTNGFFEEFDKPLFKNQLPMAFNFIKSTNLSVSKIQDDIFNVLPDKIRALQKLVRGTPAESNIEIRKTCFVKYYSTIFVRNTRETRLLIELYSQYINGNERIKFQLYKNKTFSHYTSSIENCEREFEEVWAHHSVPF